MKKVYCLLVVFVLSFYSCDDVKDALEKLTQFEIDYDSEVTIPSTTLVDIPITLDTPPVATNSDSRFENNNTRADLIESVKLKSLALTIETPESGDFDFLEEIEIFINAEGLERVAIASGKDLADDGVKVLNLETADVELKDYMQKDSFELRVSTKTDQTIEADHKIKIKSVFDVDAEILGL